MGNVQPGGRGPGALRERKVPVRMRYCEVCQGAGFHRRGCEAEAVGALSILSPGQVLLRIYKGNPPPTQAWDGFQDALAGVSF